MTIAMLRARNSGGYTQKSIADYFSIHYSRVNKIIKKARGKTCPLFSYFLHIVYKSLGINDETCCLNYHTLFANLIPKEKIEEIRMATNKAWVLGDNQFKTKINRLLGRQTQPKARGGDRRSKDYMKKKPINRVCPQYRYQWRIKLLNYKD